jgi:hypothetical protein
VNIAPGTIAADRWGNRYWVARTDQETGTYLVRRYDAPDSTPFLTDAALTPIEDQ